MPPAIRKGLPRLLLHLAIAAGLLASSSCLGRRFYRKMADQEVANVLAEKDRYQRWRIEQFHVYPDPRARFADPTNPDRPPMPPDDPAAHDLSPNPQKPPKTGIANVEGTGFLDLLASWDAENRSSGRRPSSVRRGAAAPAVPRPDGGPYSPEPSATASPGRPAPFLLTLEQAVELGLVNSREYQSRREDLYLAALPVTLERFAFAAQFFATEEAVRQRFGSDAPGGPANRWVLNGTTGFTKQFSTGALLLFRLANQTVINLSGDVPKHTVSQSTLNFELLQPLLRGGGRAVTLEPLTQTERNLLYEIREYARFREQFYVAIAAGGDIGSGTRSELSEVLGFVSPRQGFLPIMLISARLANERQNVEALDRLLKLFRAFREGGIVQQLQVDQVEQQLLDSRSQVLDSEQNYRDALDRFKLQLGLPPGTALDLDASTLGEVNAQFGRYEELLEEFKEVAERGFEIARAAADAEEAREIGLGALSSLLHLTPASANPAAVAAALHLNAADYWQRAAPSSLRARARGFLTDSAVVRGTLVRDRVARSWPEWEKLADRELSLRLNNLRGERRRLLELRDRLEVQNKVLGAEELRRLDEVRLEIDLGNLEEGLREYEARVWRREPTLERRRERYADVLRELLRRIYAVVARAREERLEKLTGRWPKLPELRVGEVGLLEAELPDAETAVAQAALANRFDLMNARARLVDTWRQIAVRANALLGVFNVRYRLESFTPFGAAQPLDFGDSRTRHQLFLNGELPLVRKAERNLYRAALIDYQRQRRDLMATEDSILVRVRDETRRLRVLAQNYTIQKRLVELAYLQVENAEDTFRAPSRPAREADDAAAAALTRQLLDAQSRLVRAQNQLYTTWINYLASRLELYRDLELLALDPRGVWNDELANLSAGAGHECGSPPDQRPPAPAGDGQRIEQLPPPRLAPPGGRPGAP